VEIRKVALGSKHPEVAESLIDLAEVYSTQRDWTRALELALESEEIAREHLRLTGRSLSEEHALRYAAARRSGLDLALSMAAARRLDPPSLRRVLDSLLRSRAVVLDGIGARHRWATLSDDPRMTDLAEELAAARARLANMTVRGLGELDPETYRALLDDAKASKERAERALAMASVAFAAELERGRLGVDEVAANLSGSSAVVSFALYEDAGSAGGQPTLSYIAFVLQAGKSNPSAISLGPAAELDALVTGWRAEVGGEALANHGARAESEYRKAAARLRESLWDPVASQLVDVGRVFVVPDGALNLVSLVALPSGQTGYLIEEGPLVQYLSAERDLVPREESIAGAAGLLAVGAPDYDASSIFSDGARTGSDAAERTRSVRSGCAGYGALSFEPLPGAAQEAEQVVQLWEDRSSGTRGAGELLYLTGAKASEAAFKEMAPGRRVLHLATHGFFLGNECAPEAGSTRGVGGIAAAGNKRPREDAESSTAPAEISPLLLSGLALAGANHRAEPGDREDGILTAEEIASLDLSGAELAVLSACDTGIGEIRAGEGVFGLRRAMQVAGVRALIMSLWPVDDDSTRLWMEAFYRGLLSGGLDPAQATREAGMAVLETKREASESAHPFYWAAFVAAGR
jgi:CHAT domain-containing protein